MVTYNPVEPLAWLIKKIGKGEIIHPSRRIGNFIRHDVVLRNHPFGADGGFQLRHPIVETSGHQPEDVGTLQVIFSPSTSRADNSGNNRRKRRVHCCGAKHIWYTTSPSRRASWVYKWHTHHCPRNVDTKLKYGSTGKIQCSPYQLQLSGNGTIGTDAGATEDTSICSNQPDKVKYEALLLELRDQL